MECQMIGNQIYKLAHELWPINRSITGDGVRKTLSIIKQHLPEMEIKEVPTGTKVFDWEVPKEWRIRDAWIRTPTGEKICHFKNNNLHLLGYSCPYNGKMTLNELDNFLFSIEEQPNAIPYITSYYKNSWGFCISHNQRKALQDGEYEVYIDSEFLDGHLTYGEVLLEGESDKEVFLSTYICHPSMANNELSGPCVTTFITKWIKEIPNRYYSYRIIFIPETIGSITYLSFNLFEMKQKIIAGFNVTCVGDDRVYSYLPSRNGKTISDDVAKHVLKHIDPSYKSYSWTDRGSDERQYCAPGVDLPIASIMRSKFSNYDEYHTSLDDLTFVVSPQGLEGGYQAIRYAIEAIENNVYPISNFLCEPQLGKRGLYPSLSTKKSHEEVRRTMDLITWSDGTKSLLEIADLCEAPIWELYETLKTLSSENVLSISR
jgi:aminopeptidase-like protein